MDLDTSSTENRVVVRPVETDNPVEPHKQKETDQKANRNRVSLAMAAMELLLPSTCRMCDRCVRSGEDFCRLCDANLRQSESLMEACCNRCGRPGGLATLDSGMAATESGCLHCRGEKLAFDQCIPLWTYDGFVRSVVVASKYGSQTALADALGRRLGARVLAKIEPADVPDWVTFVPSHLWRRLQRGMGGSRVLASAVTETCLHCWPEIRLLNALTITRRIQKQAWLGEKERAENVRGAFRLRSKLTGRSLPGKLAGKHVLLVDDVITTGATSSEIARTLKESGARRVTVAAVARAFSG